MDFNNLQGSNDENGRPRCPDCKLPMQEEVQIIQNGEDDYDEEIVGWKCLKCGIFIDE
jgi:hypothetical protein